MSAGGRLLSGQAISANCKVGMVSRPLKIQTDPRYAPTGIDLVENFRRDIFSCRLQSCFRRVESWRWVFCNHRAGFRCWILLAEPGSFVCHGEAAVSPCRQLDEMCRMIGGRR